MFTSGTTGRSKGVIKQNAADYFSARSWIEVLSRLRGVSPADLRDETYFSCLPLFHSNAQVLCAYPALLAGARVAYVERFSGTPLLAAGDRRRAPRPSTASAPCSTSSGTSRRRTARPGPLGPHDLRGPGAAATSTTSSRSASACALTEGYGLTETGVATVMDPTAPPRLGSCGVANPGYEVSIVEPGTDLPLPPETPGEIVVDKKIPNIVMRAYYGMPEKTAEDFRNLKLHTGDLGRMDADGYVYFMDRVKDYIRRRGENVSSMEVEKIVTDHPGVAEAPPIGVKAGEGASSEDEIMWSASPRAPRPTRSSSRTGWPSACPTSWCRATSASWTRSPRPPPSGSRRCSCASEGVTADTFDREAAGISISR